MSETTVREIRQASHDGQRTRDVAARFGLAVGTVNAILRGDLYPDAGGPLRPRRPRLPPGASKAQVRQAARTRLLDRREISPNGCWLYRQGGPKGYGVILLQNTDHAVHRLAYELWNGPIPDGTEVDYACHNTDSACEGGDDCAHRRCFNPDHLVARTHAENVRLGRSWAIHGRKTHCPQGHPYDEHNTRYRRQPNGGVARRCKTCARESRRRRPRPIAAPAEDR